MPPLRVLISTNMYPYPEAPWFGVFVQKQVEALRALGVEVDIAIHFGRLSRWNYLKGVFEIRRRLRSAKYDLIHSHHAYSTAVAWLGRLLAGSRTPIIMTFHDGEIFREKKRDGRLGFFERLKYSVPLRAWALRRCAFVIPVQKDMLPRVIGTDEASRMPSRVIPAGIELARFENLDRAAARAKLKHPPSEKIVFFPSAPNRPEKRFHLAEAAVELLRAENYSIHFYAAGNIPYAEMPTHLIAADAIIIPSEYETGPLVLREAAACETPVVITNVGDAAQYSDLSGVFMCEAIISSLAEGLRKALVALRPYGGMRRNRELAVDQRQVAERVLEVYRFVIAQKNS